MHRKTKSLKALALSLGLAALTAPATMDAQVINRGLLQNPYMEESNKNHSMLRQSNRDNATPGYDISNYGLGEGAPLGSGLVILLGAGLGYVALKKKEDEQ